MEEEKRTASFFLRQADEIMSERGKTYDSEEGERSMEKTVIAFNAKTGKDLTEAEGWLFMSTLKDVRQFARKNYHEDSALDGIAYSSLMAEARANE